MSLPKANDWRGLSPQELEQKKHALEKELSEFRQMKVTGQLDKPHNFKLLRRQIAQVNTIQKEKENESRATNKK